MEAELELGIVQLEKAVRESEHSMVAGILATVACIAVCVAINYFLPGSGNVSGAILPNNGGFTGFGSIIF